jgi:hypothetical protein
MRTVRTSSIMLLLVPPPLLLPVVLEVARESEVPLEAL